MNAPALHLMLVHLPVMGILFVVPMLALALWRKEAFWVRLFEAGVVLVALFGVVAYVSGGNAFESLTTTEWGEAFGLSKPLMEDHAIVGKAAFVGVLVLAGAAVAILLQEVQGSEAPPAAHWGLVIGGLVLAYVLAYAAHLGGHIRHPESAEAAIPIFPKLSEPPSAPR